MSRFLTVTLLLIVFFLVGMIYGINQDTADQQTNFVSDEEKQQQENVASMNEDREEIVEINEEDIMETSVPLTVTQKTASVIEMGVKGFYEIVVGVLYQVAQLFF